MIMTTTKTTTMMMKEEDEDSSDNQTQEISEGGEQYPVQQLAELQLVEQQVPVEEDLDKTRIHE